MDEPLGLSPTLRATEIYDVPSSKILQRGQNFFDQVYGKISKRVMGQMDRSGTEDLGLTARLMYGYILSNTHVLNAAESSFVLLAALIPQDVRVQSYWLVWCLRVQGQSPTQRSPERCNQQRSYAGAGESCA